MTVYTLPNVEPFVRDVANQVGTKFSVPTIGGWRATAGDMTGHPAGLALDFQVGSDVAKGNQVAAYFTGNASKLRVKYVLWQQRSWYPGKGWRAMEFRSGDRPGYDPNHRRHVHVSFTTEAARGDGAGVVPDDDDASDGGALWPWLVPGVGGVLGMGDAISGGNLSNNLENLAGGALDTIASPLDAVRMILSGDLWKRVGLVVGGGGLIVIGVVLLVSSSKEVQGLAGTALAAVPHPAAKAASVASTAATAATD